MIGPVMLVVPINNCSAQCNDISFENILNRLLYEKSFKPYCVSCRPKALNKERVSLPRLAVLESGCQPTAIEQNRHK